MRGFFLFSILFFLCSSFLLKGQNDSSFFAPIQRQILVRGDFNFPPYEFINEDGEFDGFNVDLFIALTQELGLDIDLKLEPWYKIRNEIEKGEIDVVMGVIIDLSRSSSMNFGTPHSVMTHAIFTNRNVKAFSLEDLKNFSVVVQKGDIMHDLLLQNNYADSIIVATSIKEVLWLVEEGKADVALLGNYQGEFIIKSEKLKNVILRTSDLEPYRYAIGVKKGDPELLWLLNSGLYQLKTNGTYDELYEKWFSAYERKNYFGEIFPFFLLSAALILFLLVFVFIFRRQSRQSKRKHRKAEKYLSAVSRMSPIGLGILSNQTILTCNDYFTQITGFGIEEIDKLSFTQFFYSEKEYEVTYNVLIDKLNNSDSASMEAHWKKKDGTSFYVHLSVTPFEKNKGRDSMLLTVTDVTFQRNALMQMRLADERLKIHLDNSPLGYLELDDNLIIQAWSAEAERIFGWSKSEVVGKKIYDFDFVFEPDVLQVETYLKKLLNKEDQRNINRHRNKTKNGVLLDCVWYNSAVYSDDGRASSIFCLVNDVSDLKRAQSQLKTEQEHSKWIIEAAQVGTWELNLQTNEISISDFYASLFGYNKRQALLLTADEWIEMIHPQDRERALSLTEDYLKREEGVLEIEARVQHKLGHYLTIVQKGSIIRKEDNKKVFTGILMDLSSLRKAEEFIRKLSIATDQSPASVIITDMDGNIEYINQKFISISGYSFEELKGKKLRIFRPGHLTDEDYGEMVRTLNLGSTWKGEHQNRKKNHERYWESVLISPITDEQGVITNFVIVSEDITERKAIQHELVNAKEQAEESDRLKTSFLKNLSHEVRTPLNAIAGFSEILYDAVSPTDKSRSYASAIIKSSRQLLAMMDNIINISVIEAGKLTINYSETDINQLLNEVYNQITLISTNSDVELRINSLIPRKTGKVLIDQMKLHQILSNIISNGFKFSTQGVVEVKCEMDDRFIYFSVYDNGIGIPETIKESIFNQFSQGDNTVTGIREGLGVGLSVVKSYLDLMGGSISFESERGKGTTFHFSVPYKFIESSSEKTFDLTNLEWPADKKILVVDDVEMNYQVISGMLSHSGAPVLYAMNGYEAISIVEEDKDVALVFMDIRMPELNGWDATRAIKKINPDLPVIIYTAYSLSDEEEKMKEVGCDDRLIKPIDSKELALLLNKYLSKINEASLKIYQ